MTAAGTRRALEAALLELDPRWTVVANLAAKAGADEVRANYLLLHPARGIALLDLAEPAQSPIAALRRFLDRQRWRDFLPGALPIVHLVVGEVVGKATGLERRLDEAFAAAEPLGITDADWPDSVTALVTAQQSPRAWLGSQTSVAAPFERAAEAAGFTLRAVTQAPISNELGEALPAAKGATARVGGWPRWQTVIATVSLAIFGYLYLNLPEQPPSLSPAVEIAVGPASAPAPPIAEPKPAASAAVPIHAPPAIAKPAATKRNADSPPGIGPAAKAASASPPKPVYSAAVLPPIPAQPATVIAKSDPSHPVAKPVEKASAAPVPAERPRAAVAAAVAQAPTKAEQAAAAPPHPSARIASLPPEGQRASTSPVPPARAAQSRTVVDSAQKRRAMAALAGGPRHRIETPQPALAADPPVRKTEVADLIHRNCRRYSSRITVLGIARDVAGLACQASDGSWQIVSEASEP